MSTHDGLLPCVPAALDADATAVAAPLVAAQEVVAVVVVVVWWGTVVDGLEPVYVHLFVQKEESSGSEYKDYTQQMVKPKNLTLFLNNKIIISIFLSIY